MASNCHGIEPIGSVRRWSRAEGRQINIAQPALINKYNNNMGGVDRMDQNISVYRISIRSRKWWWPLFAYLLDVAMQNSWLIYRMTSAAKRRPLDQLEFRRDVCNACFIKYKVERPAVGRVAGRPKPLDVRVPRDIRHDGKDHFLASNHTQRRCAVCGLKVRKICKKCDVGLHMECFESFHKDYWIMHLSRHLSE